MFYNVDKNLNVSACSTTENVTTSKEAEELGDFWLLAMIEDKDVADQQADEEQANYWYARAKELKEKEALERRSGQG